MIRIVVSAILVLAVVGVAQSQEKKDLPKELVPFQGTWKVVKASAGGKEEKEIPADLRFTFAAEKVIVKEGKREPDAGTYAVNTKKEPNEIDLISPKGEKIPGLYKFDKDGKMTLCFIKSKDSTRPKGFDDKEAVLMVLEKTKE